MCYKISDVSRSAKNRDMDRKEERVRLRAFAYNPTRRVDTAGEFFV